MQRLRLCALVSLLLLTGAPTAFAQVSIESYLYGKLSGSSISPPIPSSTCIPAIPSATANTAQCIPGNYIGSGGSNPGTQYQGAYYATSSSTVSGTNALQTNAGGEFVAPQGLVYPDTVVTSGTSCTVDSTCGSATHDTSICLDLGTPAPYTVALPPSPVNGRTISFKDCVGQLSQTNTLTISGNGHNIDSVSTAILNSPYQELTVRYVSAVTLWSIR